MTHCINDQNHHYYKSSNNLRKVAVLIAATSFMEQLDATVITTSLPIMAESFLVQPQDLSIGISSYILALVVGLPASSWMAQRFTTRRVFACAIFFFILASLLCALSSTLFQFICARLLQGFSAAMMVPVGRVVVLKYTEKHDLVNTISILVWPALIAPVIGPLVGGLISEYLSWHWIFLLNIPFGFIALRLTLKWIVPEPIEKSHFDWIGFLSFGIGLLLFVYSLEFIAKAGSDLVLNLITLFIGIVFILLSIYHLLHTKVPLFNFNAFTKRTFRVATISGALFRITLNSVPFLLPLMFQIAFNWRAVTAGSLLLVLFTANILMKTLTTKIIQHFGFKNVLVVNGIGVVLSFLLCAFFTPTDSLVWITVVLFFSGATRSLQFTAINTMTFADIHERDIASANVVDSELQQISHVLGIVCATMFLYFASVFNGNEGMDLTLADFKLSFMLMSALPVVALLNFLILPNNVGANVSGYRATNRTTISNRTTIK